MPTLEKERPAMTSSVLPFAVVADHHRNGDLLLQSIPGCRLRSALSATRSVVDAKSGERFIPPDQARQLGQLPALPGMELRIDPANRTYEIVDPLHEDEDLCERLRLALNRTQMTRITGKLRGVAPQRGTLDVHRMKTLVREIIWLLDEGDATMVGGSRPTLDQLDEMPGHFLLNPGSRVKTTQPMFERDLPKWIDRMTSQGN